MIADSLSLSLSLSLSFSLALSLSLSLSLSLCWLLQAPCEAEAQCAAMVKAGIVYATATEDMDSLTFGSNVMLRHLTTSEAKYEEVLHFDLCH